MKIFIISPNNDVLFTPQHKQQLEQQAQVTYQSDITDFQNIPNLFTGTEPRILAIDPDFSDWKFPNNIIDQIPNLQAIVLQTTSFSWLDVDHAKQKGIPVINLRGFSSTAVAEWNMMMLLGLARRLPLVIKDNWQQNYTTHQGIELSGKTVGIIGLGTIGTKIAQNCQGIGMHVQYWSQNSRDNRFTYTELHDLMKTSDVIIPAVAQNNQTQSLLTDEMLRSMKQTTIFVSNIHDVYNHQLLLDMVKNNQLFGYAFENSKTTMTDYQGNVWAGPELAWCTKESLQKNADCWVKAIIQATQGNYPNQINK